MCGRYSQTAPLDVVMKRFEIAAGGDESLSPRYNLAPTQDAPVVVIVQEQGRRLKMMRWGLVPSWAKDCSIGNKLINARGETILEKTSFKRAFQRRRCLVVADGFYEWKRAGGRKQPMRIVMRDRQPFGMAGLWEAWRSPEGESVESFTIITTEANEMIRGIHNRMPVILKRGDEGMWLD
ncbi:MAG: SOS response-associated peptidase, partial [bacterium]